MRTQSVERCYSVIPQRLRKYGVGDSMVNCNGGWLACDFFNILGWNGGAEDWSSDFRSRVRALDSRSRRGSVTTLYKLSRTFVSPPPSSIIWYWPKSGDVSLAGKVTVGLASHWPCVINLVI